MILDIPFDIESTTRDIALPALSITPPIELNTLVRPPATAFVSGMTASLVSLIIVVVTAASTTKNVPTKNAASGITTIFRKSLSPGDTMPKAPPINRIAAATPAAAAVNDSTPTNTSGDASALKNPATVSPAPLKNSVTGFQAPCTAPPAKVPISLKKLAILLPKVNSLGDFFTADDSLSTPPATVSADVPTALLAPSIVFVTASTEPLAAFRSLNLPISV